MNRPSYGYSAAEGSGEGQAPVCPRHPDRVSYVRCQRCDRPTCGECHRPAAVGVLCVDCERDIARAQRSTQPRNAMGGATQRQAPYVTYAIIAICGVMFLAQTLLGGIVEQLLIFAPFRALAYPWTFISAGFLHGSIIHLALNLYALWAVGQYLEQTVGRVRFAAIFLVSVIGGHVAVLLLADPMVPEVWQGGTLGASGGVFGLFGAMFIVNRRLGGQAGQILVLIGVNLAIPFFVPNISWQGHLGGLVLGTAMTAAMFALRPKATPGADRTALAQRAALLHAGVVGAALALCLVLILVKTALVPDGYLLLPLGL